MTLRKEITVNSTKLKRDAISTKIRSNSTTLEEKWSGWRDGSVVKGTGYCSSRRPGSVPSTHMEAHSHLKLWFQGIWCHLWPLRSPDIQVLHIICSGKIPICIIQNKSIFLKRRERGYIPFHWYIFIQILWIKWDMVCIPLLLALRRQRQMNL